MKTRFSSVRGWIKLVMFLVGFLCFLTGGWWLYCLRENELGRREWMRVKAELEEGGEKLDWESFVPEPVPDELNFAKSPVIEDIIYLDGPASALKRRIRAWDISRLIRHFANPDQQDRANLAAVADALRLSSTNPPQEVLSPVAAFLEWAEPIESDLQQIQRESRRPLTQFKINPTNGNGIAPSLIDFVALREISQTATLLSAAHLGAGDGQVALALLGVSFAMSRGLEGGVTLVESMIGVTVETLSMSVVWEGLVEGSWNDAQLVELEQVLATRDWAAGLQYFMRSERAALMGYYTDVDSMLGLYDQRLIRNSGFPRHWEALGRKLLPDGWAYQAGARYCRIVQDTAVAFYDRGSRVVSPTVLDKGYAAINTISLSHHPRERIVGMALPNFLKAYMIACRLQVRIDHASITIALERSRLKYGTLPRSLEELSPEFIEALPGELIGGGGGTYQYRTLTDDHYMIWSRGWNELDEDGAIAASLTDGDWVWFSFAGDEVIDQAATP